MVYLIRLVASGSRIYGLHDIGLPGAPAITLYLYMFLNISVFRVMIQIVHTRWRGPISLREGISREIALHSVETISHTFILAYMQEFGYYILFRACRKEGSLCETTQDN